MFRKTVLARALSMAFSAAALAAMVPTPAMAQSNATGNILGTVASPAGASIALQNTETGSRRTANVDPSGRYLVTALPPGHYRVDLMRDGKVASSTEVDVLIGQGADASFSAVTAVQVVGRRSRIDVSNTNNGATFTAKELQKLPLATDLTSIILLAPNTTRADAAYGGASFGGSGASENAFYVNGFPITNPLTQLGSMELPFGAIAQASVVTGGFGAEFGRSIGGVMSITTKSGTNNWEVGAQASITPNQWNSKSRNIYYEKTGVNPPTDGKLHYRHDNDYTNVEQYGAYLGGPIIKDKLFMFVAADETVTRLGFTDRTAGAGGGTGSTSLGSNGWNQRRELETRYAAKLDWNLTDNHRIEFTAVGDNSNEKRQTYGYVLNPNNPNAKADMDGVRNEIKYNELSTRNPGSSGADVNALKYTGQLTDDLTLTSMYGILKTKRGVLYEGVGTNVPPTITVPGVANRVPSLEAQGLYRNFNKYPGNLTRPGEDEVKSFRLDLEYKIGSHTVRAGLDDNKLSAANAGLERSGGASWTYRRTTPANPCAPASLSGARFANVCSFGGFGTAGYYARESIFSSITNAKSAQSAQYIEDRFQVTQNLLVTGGIRNESYSNTNGDGEKFMDMKNQVAPRLAASWDVNGDSSFKISGTIGRYYLQLPTQVAARAASRSQLTTQDFTYTGIDPATGVPTGRVAINTPISVDGEYNQRKDPRAVVMKDLKPNFQDEVTLGFEKVFSPALNFGAKATYRKLGAGIDDNCDSRRLYDRALKLGIPVVARDFMNCYIFNPGSDATVWIDGHDQFGQPIVTGKGQYTTFTAADLGFPKAERTYTAIDLFAEHPLRDGWYGKVNYTWSRSKGNMEGQTRSDTGQTDVATSAAWDFPEFQVGSSGRLPNDRTHQLKVYGYYEISSEWGVGINALIQTGRPKACLGTNFDAEAGESGDPYGATQGGSGYGPEYYYCAGKPLARGSFGNLPTEKQLDLNLTYRPAKLKDLSLKLDVFNAFNSQQPLARQETYDDGSVPDQVSNYGEARTLQAARTMKFTVEYNHKF